MSSLKKNFGYQIAYRVLTVITPLITSPIVYRALGADNLGIYSATQAFANYFMFLAMLGIETYGQRTIAAAPNKEKRQKLFWEIYSVQAVASTISIIFYIFAVAIFGGDRTCIMYIQGFWILSCLLNIGWFFFGLEEFKVTVTRSFAIKLITVICVVLFIRKPEHLILYTIIMACGTTISELLLWFSLFRRIKYIKPSWIEIKPHIIPIFRLFIPVIALSVYHIMDKSMLDLLSTEANVGWYYAVDKIVYIPLGLITAISTVMLTRVSYVINNESRNKIYDLLKKSSELTMFLTCAVSFGIAAISKEFIPFFFGPGYEPCVKLMYCFLPVLLIKAIGDVVRTQFLIPSKRDNLYTIAVISGAFTNVLFNIMLIPSFGALGAVFGTLASEFVVLMVQVFGCIKEVNFVSIFSKHLFYLLLGALMLLIVRLFANSVVIQYQIVKLLCMIGIGAVSYLFLCSSIWLFKKDSIFYRDFQRLFFRR